MTATTRARGLLALWLLAIYSTLGVARDVTNRLRELELLRIFVGAAFAATVVVVIVVLVRSKRFHRALVGGVVVGSLTVYAAVVFPMASIEEKMHFLEYGVVGLLALGSMPRRWPTARRLVAALLLTTAAGWLDEGIQALLPSRHYDLRDVGMNALAGMLALLTWAGASAFASPEPRAQG